MAAFGEKALFGSQGETANGEAMSSVAARRGISLHPLHHIKNSEDEGAHASSPDRRDANWSLEGGEQQHPLPRSGLNRVGWASSLSHSSSTGARRFSHFVPRPQKDVDDSEFERTRSFDGAEAIKSIIERYEQKTLTTISTVASDSPSSSLMTTPMSCPARMTWHRPPPAYSASPGGVHPLVAVLRGMRNRGVENMAYAMAMSKRAEESEPGSEPAPRDEEGHGKFFKAGASPMAGKEQAAARPLLSCEDELRAASSSSTTRSASSSPGKHVLCASPTPKLQKKREMSKIHVDAIYNIIVDGSAGHVLLDTRCESVFMEGHIMRSMGVKQACERRGKHFVLVSETGEMMAREWQAVRELESTEGALSIKVLEGGFGAFEENYPFLCERSGATAAEEMERKRGATRRWLPSRISRHLFIGGKECAEDADTCRMLKIDHILSILMDPRAVRVPPGVLHLPLSIEDEAHEDISVFFEQSYRWIDAAIKSGCRVLVHCKVGRCRSATICVVYLMRSRGLSLDEALKLLKSCRRQVHINHGFMHQLKTYEIKFFGSAGVGGVPKVPPVN